MKKITIVALSVVMLSGCVATGQSRMGKVMNTDRIDDIALCQVAYHGESTEEKIMAYQELVYRGLDPRSQECERHAAQVHAFGDSVVRLVGEKDFHKKVSHIKPEVVEGTTQYGGEIDLIELFKGLK